MTSASIESALLRLSLLLDAILILRLFYLKLFRNYPLFVAMLSVAFALQMVAVVYGDGSRRFAWAYWYLEPIKNILYILVVWELFSVIFRDYAGLRSLSRWVMGVAAVLAMVGGALTAVPTGGVSDFNRSAHARTVIRFERGVALGLVIFIIVMLYFISRYPIKLPRNNVVLCMLYSGWFLGDAAILLVMNYVTYSHRNLDIENTALLILQAASYLGWAVLLTRAGEFQETRVRQHLSTEREELLIGELNAMNDLLVRAGRSISHSS